MCKDCILKLLEVLINDEDGVIASFDFEVLFTDETVYRLSYGSVPEWCKKED